MAEKYKQWALKNLQTGEEVSLHGIIRIGRSQENTIVVDDEKVSWFHATIWEDVQKFYIRDEGSTNGTSVNGQYITDPTMLPAGARIRIGNTSFVMKARIEEKASSVASVGQSVSSNSFPWIPFSIVACVLLLIITGLLVQSNADQTPLVPEITLSPEVDSTPTGVFTPVLTLLPTSTPALSPTVTTVVVQPSSTVGFIYPEPILDDPADNSSFRGLPGPILQWESQSDLSGDEFYRIIIDYSHEGGTWREVGWSQRSSWQTPDYLPSLITSPNNCHWYVQVVRVTDRDVAGEPTDGIPLSPVSETWRFVWTNEAPPPENLPVLTPTVEPRP
mgnify:CR=1 FL=1